MADQRFEIPLTKSINTDTVDRDITEINAGDGKSLVNTGTCMDGGVTNVYVEEDVNVNNDPRVWYANDGSRVTTTNVTRPDGKVITFSLSFVPVVRTPLVGYYHAISKLGGGAIAIGAGSAPANVILYDLDQYGAILGTRPITIASPSGRFGRFRLTKQANPTLAGLHGIHYYENIGGNYYLNWTDAPLIATTVNITTSNVDIFANPSVNKNFIACAQNENIFIKNSAGSTVGTNERFAHMNSGDADTVYFSPKKSSSLGVIVISSSKISTLAVTSNTTTFTSHIVTQSGVGFFMVKNALDSAPGNLSIVTTGLLRTSVQQVPPYARIGFDPPINSNYKLSIINDVFAQITGNTLGPSLIETGDIRNLDLTTSQTASQTIYEKIDGTCVIIYTPLTTAERNAKSTFQEVSNGIFVNNSCVAPNAVNITTGETFTVGMFDPGYTFPVYSVGNTYARKYQKQYAESYPSPLQQNAVISDDPIFYYPENIYDIYKNGICTSSPDPTRIGQTYLASLQVPAPADAIYEGGGINMLGQSAFATPRKTGYLIQNQLPQDLQMFQLYGQSYGFDGADIYILNTSGASITSVQKTATANGLTLLCETPNFTVFLSPYDNVLYGFDGGRSVQKIMKFNRKPAITKAVWNTAMNAIVCLTASSILTIRDGVVTENALTETDPYLFSSYDAVKLVLKSNRHTKSYYYKQRGVIVPLDWQTAYFGQSRNQLQIVSEYVITLLNETKDNTHIDGQIITIHDGGIKTQNFVWDIKPAQWLANDGYLRMRVKPANAQNLGSSIRLKTNNKLIIMQADMVYQPYVGGTISETRSK